MSPTLLEACDVTCGYGGPPVLEHVSLQLAASELVGLIGPNGSGKSTLLRVLARTLAPSHGSVRITGEPAEAMKARDVARRVAVVPQSEPAVFEFTARQVVLMGRHPWSAGLGADTREDLARADRAMAATDTLAFSNRPITALSGGERQRVLLARALAQGTPILLLDEPTAHLDIGHQAEALRMATKLARDGASVIAALHDLNLAAEYCDRLILLASGRVAAEGRPEQVLKPETLSAAYGTPIQVSVNPSSGRPLVSANHPATGVGGAWQAPGIRVHVVCGGGSGISAMAELVRRGFVVTAGVLNRLDSDEFAATALSIEHAVEAPFSPISPSARAACAVLMERAEAIVVTDAHFGRGNLANLELVADAMERGTAIYLLATTPIEGRDFTGGAAMRLWSGLEARGAVLVDGMTALVRELGQHAGAAGSKSDGLHPDRLTTDGLKRTSKRR